MADPKAPQKPAPAAGAAETSFFEDIVTWARSKTSASADRGITDTITQAAKLFYSVTYGDLFSPGDQRFSQDLAARLDTYMDQNGKPKDFGKYDLMMAAGWQPKGKIKVNGVETTFDKPIENMLAVFVRNRDGNVEILDPSIKVTKLTQMPRVLDAITPYGLRAALVPSTPILDAEYKKMLMQNTPSDQKWRDTAGVFVMVQLAPVVLSAGLGAVGKVGTMAASKMPQLESAVATAGKVNAAAIKAAAPLTISTTTSGLAGISGQLGQSFYFSPEAVRKIADSVSATMNMRDITPESVRRNLNSALHEFSFDQGSDAKQIYIPSLKDYDQPWTRLQQTLQGAISAHEKPNSPFDAWPAARHVSATDVREALKVHPGVVNAFYTGVEKVLGGKPLTDRDLFVLRCGLKLGPEDAPGVSANINPAGKAGTMKFTPEERAETLKYITEQLPMRLRDKAIDSPAFAKQMKIDPEKIDLASPQFTPAQIKTFVAGEAKASGDILMEQRREALAKAQGQVMALGMGL